MSPREPIPLGFDLAVLRSKAPVATAMLKAFGNQDRLTLICQMALKECTVSELEQLTGIGQPALSQQLSVLRRQGVVRTRRDGKFIWYVLSDERALRLMQVINELFCLTPHEAVALAEERPMPDGELPTFAK